MIATQPSDRYPKDVVMSQQPPSGARVREGRQISLVVSSGVTIFPMPDLRFESLRNAGLDLNRFKLQLDKTTYVSRTTTSRATTSSRRTPCRSRACGKVRRCR